MAFPKPLRFSTSDTWRLIKICPILGMVSMDDDLKVVRPKQEPGADVWLLFDVVIAREIIEPLDLVMTFATDGMVYHPISISPSIRNNIFKLKISRHEYEDVVLSQKDLPIINNVMSDWINDQFEQN